MKKIIFIIHFSLFTIICSAQNYEWQPIIPGIDCDDSTYLSCRVTKLVEDTLRNTIWMIGVFDGAAGIQSPNCIGFNGINFVPFPGIMDSAIASAPTGAIMHNGDLIICGDNKIYRYDLVNNVSSVIGTANNDVYCVGIYNGDLIAGGAFFDIDGYYAHGIARWINGQWDSLGVGIYGSTHIVLCIENYNGKLYAGGTFDGAGDAAAWNIAVWDGIAWDRLCSTVGVYGTDQFSGNHSAADVFDMEVYNAKLYITGRFEKVCNINCYLAYWNDTTWTGTNYGGEGNKLIVVNNRLIVRSPAGPFLFYADSVTLTGVDTAFSGGDNDEAVFQNILYAGGGFSYSGNTPVFRIARLMVSPHVYVSLSVCTGSSYDFNGTLLTTAGVYTDTLIDASGLDSIVTLTLSFVTINPAISISNDTLTATGDGTIQWYNCNTHAFINTQTGNTFVLTNTGSYAAIFTNGNCIDTTDCITYTGVNDVPPNSEANVLQIYPNPANETITIALNSNCNNCIIQLYNLMGEKIISQSIEKNKTEINVSALAAGVYFIKVSNEQWCEVQKFVKE